MPNSKNSLIRYKILDELLSDHTMRYNIDTLLDKLNRRLLEDGSGEGISKRTLQYDLQYMEQEFQDCITIVREPMGMHSEKTDSDQIMNWIHYEDRSQSIFVKPMTENEKQLISQTLSLLGHFEGIPNMDGLERLRSLTNTSLSNNSVVRMESCCLENTSFFGELFSAITNRKAVKLVHHEFQNPEEKLVHIIHPHQLREYNNRWYVVGRTEEDNGRLSTTPWLFRLDSLDSVEVLIQHKYCQYTDDFDEYFEDVIGVTNYKDVPCQTIVFWISDTSKGYAESKPFHGSWKKFKGDKEADYRARYPQLEGGAFFQIECKDNYELIRELSSFGEHLVVLEPSNIQKKIYERAKSMCHIYEEIEK